MDNRSSELTSLAERIKHCRGVPEKLSTRELDAIAGLHQGHTWAIESGERTNPEYDTVKKLSVALGARVGWLLEGEGRPPSASDVREAVRAARERHASAPKAKRAGKAA